MSEVHQRLQQFQGTDGWVSKRKRCCAQYFLELLSANTGDTSSIFDAYTSWLIRMGRPWDICEKTLREQLARCADRPTMLRSSTPCPRITTTLVSCLRNTKQPRILASVGFLIIPALLPSPGNIEPLSRELRFQRLCLSGSQTGGPPSGDLNSLGFYMIHGASSATTSLPMRKRSSMSHTA